MDLKREELQKRLFATFKVEAEEHYNAMASGLVELEQGNREILETIYREAHSLKGAARAVNLIEIEKICQSMESIFSDLTQKRIPVTPEVMDTLHQALGKLKDSLGKREQTVVDKGESVVQETDRPLQNPVKTIPTAVLAESISSQKARREPDRPISMPVTMDTVRVATEKLDSILLQTEELVTEKAIRSQQNIELSDLYTKLSSWKKEWSRIRPEVRLGRTLNHQNGNGVTPAEFISTIDKLSHFLEWNKDFWESIDYELLKLTKSFGRSQRTFDGTIDTLLDDVKSVSMLPFSTILESFSPFVREISREKGKQVQLEVRGETIEVDRRILEVLKDPLLHLIRNCIDHGIETPEVRRSRSKPERGTISIQFSYREGRQVEVMVSDDGEGVNLELLKAKALRHGVLEPEEIDTLDERRALSLVFLSGISTSHYITDISGRGLGLAIVREKVDKLRGEITIETKLHEGTTFRMLLPLTLATFRGTLVQVESKQFVIPSHTIERVLKIKRETILTVENQETIPYFERTIPLVYLASILELPQSNRDRREDSDLKAVAIDVEDKKIAFVVDEVLEEREILVKSLGPQLVRVLHIAGATVLGTGRVVPVLNVSDLMYSAINGRAAQPKPVTREPEPTAIGAKSILVVEDSITSRILIKTILETAGYAVETAVDGIDGFTKLQNGHFDIIVSDVDMPGMNGFALTEKVRGSQRFSEIPVVLVTALESREDRERGIDVGASAYIVKSSFDQSNLLETIKRLL